MSEQNEVANQDVDPIETQEWLDALDSIVKYEGSDRAQFVLQQLMTHASQTGVAVAQGIHTPYLNTLSPEEEQHLPDNGVLQERLIDYHRWNALVMVMAAAEKKEGLGGHLASYASMAMLIEVGLNYIFNAPKKDHAGDLIYFQGHSAEGIYARAYLEGRLSEQQLKNFRQEAFDDGLSSYPHPHLMPEFWQFPTVSMGLGPLMAIYQAQNLKYLQHRGLAETTERKVWAFCGDGEMGEVESLGALNIAGREQLDNLIFVINCNSQRLDGPVWGNGKIIQEYEGVYRGAGWNVIKVIWGSRWEPLFAKDTAGLLKKRIEEIVDGEYQAYTAKDGAYAREHFFGRYEALKALVADMSDEEIAELMVDLGGHDANKVYAAYKAALAHKGQPTVILFKTVKGYGLGREGQGLNITHNVEELSEAGLLEFRDRFKIPLDDAQAKALSFYKPSDESDELRYLKGQREKLGGFLPARDASSDKLTIPKLDIFKALLSGSGDRTISTGMAFARILMALLKDNNIKELIVPIVADEARSLGLEGLFRQVGIYAPNGQCYVPEDRKQLVYYREETGGQLLQQGITEAGAMASWIAAATSYANSKTPLIPFYTYYSMFGYQRVGDLVWASGDIQARGFIVGGLSGRTTLPGEGLQHQDHHNLLMFSMVPSCISYDPCFAYELAVIIHDGLRRMYGEQENIFYYVTTMSENYQQPAMPEGVEAGILKGMYLYQAADAKHKQRVQLLGSGAILREVIAAAEILIKRYQIAADVWSVTSFNELRRDIESNARDNRLNSNKTAKQSYVETCLADQTGPVVAATDFMKLMAEQIRPAIKAPYYVLGTDGYGRSDSRKALRDFFEVDAKMIAYTAIKALADAGEVEKTLVTKAIKDLKIDVKRQDPATL